ncbi:AarF/ABC1/UbiB kinase family protein [Arenibacter sp. M-2]|uniref:ABC1 kinase family protein n=1 Tax=Arenibacter sp. M-2 TaxID=3053612 RepID=UPI00257059B1|nr:AarF/ABC1/UbiB kinase family protein [Arenibacter sp. M-2]MDL5512380.1 AarF/ABC1/UbiB kinase family protein [Arenibacter sp. M-2]|tara:strand:- start:11342 stop:13024 length:1683 start_codon:yes stop_codon:yes gene_type:complete
MFGIKLPQKQNLKRYNALFMVLTKYGFEDIMANSQARKFIPKKYLLKHPDTEKRLSGSTFQRIRMVLEELGPSYVKMGQIMSNRDDMLPPDLVKELEKLQDHAPTLQNFEVEKVLSQELNINCPQYFLSIDPKPLAAASLAQVHKAQLLNGDWVALKIQRPNIAEVIASDISIMKEVAEALEKYSAQVKAFQPAKLVESFEKSVNEELSFHREMDNMEHFARNFMDNNDIYVPKLYRELSNDHIICMEWIDGIKVSELEKLKAKNIDSSAVAKVGVDLYLEQVLEHGFFHADPHPGNLFVLPEVQKICFIDFGMMGTIMPKDKEALIDLLLCFLKKDVRKLIPVLKKIAIRSEIPDEKKLEYDLYELVEGISNTSIRNIKLGITLKQFKNVLYENKITIPHYLYILIRALVIIEGVGLKLDPEFNITDNLEPYMAKITRKRFGLKRLFKKNLNRFQDYNALLDKLPDDINEIVDKIKDGKLVIVHEHKGLDEFRKTLKTAFNRLVYAVIIAALSIGSALLVMADMPPKVSGIPVLGAIGFGLSAIIGLVILISIYRSKKE